MFNSQTVSKPLLLLPLCIAVSSYMLTGCSSTPEAKKNSYVPSIVRNILPASKAKMKEERYEVKKAALQAPVMQAPVIQSQSVVSALLDEDSLDELADLLEATDMTMVEDNLLAIQQYGNLWNRLRAGYGLDHNKNLYNERIEAQKNWFIPRQDYLNRLSARASRYLYHTVREAERRNIPTELALLPVIESSYDPTATSNAAAAGLWQFIPSTGRIYGLTQSNTYDGRRDVIESTRAAYDFLTTLYNRFGSWELALAAYNAGPSRIRRAINANEARGLATDFWSLKLPKETMSYVPRFLAVSQIVNNPTQYGVNLPAIANRQHFRSVPVNHGVGLADVSKVTGISYDELRMLNPALIAGSVDASGPKRVVIPNQISVGLDSQLTTLVGYGNIVAAGNNIDYNNDPYSDNSLSNSSSGLADFASNAKVPSQTTSYIEPTVQYTEPAITRDEVNRINAELIESNTLPTTSATMTSNATITQEPPLTKTERDFIAYQIKQQTPEVEEVVSSVDGNIKLDAVQTQQSILQAKGEEKQLSFSKPKSQSVKAKPKGRRSVYVVKKGETLSTIAARAGLDWHDVAKWNQIDPNANLRTGTSLYLYNAKPMSARSTSKASTTSQNIPKNSYSGKTQSYKVRAGDTLSQVAARYGLSLEKMAGLNNLSTRAQINIGQRLKVPARTSPQKSARTANSVKTTNYKVKSGDTLSQVAARAGVRSSDIAAINDFKSNAQLKRGQIIKLPASATKARTTAKTRTISYKVKSGDTLSQVAQRHGVSTKDLAAANNMTTRSALIKGRTIKIPSTSTSANSKVIHNTKRYTVKSGDTLIGLAGRYNVSVADLARTNKLTSKTQLRIGQKLKVPAGKSSSSSKSSTSASLGKTQSYKVKSGDTLIGLAKRYGVSTKQLAAANNISTNTKLRRGQRIKVPVLTISYRVRSGDTLNGLAKRFGVTKRQIASMNNLSTSTKLKIGQKLSIPRI